MNEQAALTETPSAGSQEKRASASDEKLEHIELSIGGMTCAHCPVAIEKALSATAGVQRAQVNLASRMARIDFDPAQIGIADLLQAIRNAGYAAGTAQARIPIANMHCCSCTTRVERALQTTPGVIAAHASLVPGAADVEYLREKTSFAAIRRSRSRSPRWRSVAASRSA